MKGKILGWKKTHFSRNDRGDTIIEVLLSLTILALALASAYSLSSASLRNSVSANQRTEALALAQSQVDLLTNAKDNNTSFATDYMTATPYCINPDGTQNKNVGTDKLCSGFNNSIYNVGISFSSDTDVFTVTAQWGSPDAPGGIAKMNLYYKLPGVYQQALVSTGAVTNLTQTSATFNGSVDPNGVALTDCYFKYGPTTDYGLRVSCSSTPSGTSGSSPVSAPVSGLTPNSSYHFVLCATNKTIGTNCGNDVAFNTAVKPTATTQAASSVGSTSVTLNGTANPNGSALTDCYFDFGTTTAYDSRINCSSLPGGTSGDLAVSGSTSSINSNTTYHFRLCATNAAGTACGTDQSFRTLQAFADLTVSGTTTINNVATRCVGASGNTLNVSSAAGFAANDLVLVIQMITGSGTTPLGTYQRYKIVSISGNSLILDAAATGFSTNADDRCQVVKVERYNNVTVQPGGVLTAPAWNGTTGGVLAIEVDNALTVASGGRVDMSGKGRSGGAPGPQHDAPYCSVGYNGGAGDGRGGAAGGIGGQGGSTYGGYEWWACGIVSGYSAGGAGGGGTSYTLPSRLLMGAGGGGGGGGGSGSSTPGYPGGNGGNGGGIVYITYSSAANGGSMAGTIMANGLSGGAGSGSPCDWGGCPGGAGGGGGGGGGSVYVSAGNISFTGSIAVSGGNGGPGGAGWAAGECVPWLGSNRGSASGTAGANGAAGQGQH